MMLLLWVTSCTSTPQKKTVAKITPPDPFNADGEMVIKAVPAGIEFTPDTDGVFMPFWYFNKLFNYIVDTQAMQEIK